MKLLSRPRGGQAVLSLLGCLLLVSFSSVYGANIGTVVPVVGQVSDLAYDAQRGLVYLANISESDVEIYSVGSKGLIGKIPTGQSPSSLAMSPDSSRLYVANSGSLSISVIDLNSQQSLATYTVTSRPDSIAVGYDGLVLILGPSGLIRLDPSTGVSAPLAISVPAVPPGLAPGAPTAVPAAFRAGMVASASGSLIVGLSTNRLFVYDVASGTVLHSRNVTGLLAILSIAPDGSRFMAGPFLFDTQTMAAAALIVAASMLLIAGVGPQPVSATVVESFSSDIENAEVTTFASDEGIATVWVKAPQVQDDIL
jgi:YVTN family beta-propeller protein